MLEYCLNRRKIDEVSPRRCICLINGAQQGNNVIFFCRERTRSNSYTEKRAVDQYVFFLYQNCELFRYHFPPLVSCYPALTEGYMLGRCERVHKLKMFQLDNIYKTMLNTIVWCESGIKLFVDDGFILTREFRHYHFCVEAPFWVWAS